MTKILTTDNKSYDLDKIPDETDDIRYCVFDYSNPKDTDYYFVPLIFLESFNEPAVVLSIGKFTIQMPLSWSMLVCDDDYSDLEIMPITSLNDRGFYTMVYNPYKHMVPRPQPISITNVYSDVKWYFPKLKTGNILVVPLEDNVSHPNCCLFIKDTAKMTGIIDIGSLFE